MSDETPLQAAIEFAVRHHAGQHRDGGRLPYVSHCFDVLKVAARCGVLDEVTGPAAMCHDTLEDCPGVTRGTLAAAIGGRAAAVVGELTFAVDPADRRPKGDQKAEHLRELAGKSVEAVAIKACDRYCNVADLIADRSAYAAEYLAKGEPIFAAVEGRRDDLDRKWGAGTADRLLGLAAELRQWARPPARP